jgi:membrane-associated phospholipid phosphatase
LAQLKATPLARQNGQVLESALAVMAMLLFLAAAALAAWWVAGHPDLVRGWAHGLLERPPVRRLTDRYQRQLAFLARRLNPNAAFGLWLTVGLAVIVSAGWALGELAEAVQERDDLAVHDSPVAAWLSQHRVEWLTGTMRGVTWLGSGLVTIPLMIVAAPLLARPGHRRRTAVIAVIIMAGTSLLVHSIKFLMARPRPTLEEVIATAVGFAFPSGHTAQAVAVYGTLAFLICLRLVRWRHRVAVCTAALVLILVIGFSRLYLGVHWLTDVLGGFVLAGLWLAVVLTAANVLGEFGRGRATRASDRAPEPR